MQPERVSYSLVDEASFPAIPAPARPGSRCQTCDYWERLDGSRDAPDATATDASAREAPKLGRLLAGRKLAGAYGMLAWRSDGDDRVAIGWAQFGPLSAYPRALAIRERYPELPDSPAIGELVPGYVATNWYALFAPRGLPAAIAARLQSELPKAREYPGGIQRVATQLRAAIESHKRRFGSAPASQLAAHPP